MTGFVSVAQLVDLPPGSSKLVRVDKWEIALFNIDGDVYAIEDSCPHAGSSLSTGRLRGRTIHCRAHGLHFDLATGCMQGVAGVNVWTFPVVIHDGAIEVKLP
ncbi:MAG: Rieske 2Fe-2S domain-containing protein [Candidatus Aquilonibacter sp.]